MPRKQKKYHFIYKTTNLINGKYYYGLHSTHNLDDGYLGSGRRIRYSINKYGKDNHRREILEFCNTRKELVNREKEIVTLNEIAKNDCLNLIVGGASIKSVPKDVRERIGYSRRGKKVSKDIRKKMSESHTGKVVSDETKEKIRKTLTSSNLSKERIDKISKTRKKQLKDKTNHPLFGKTHSLESKLKMSNAQKGVAKRKLKCPHCGKVGGEPQLKQWHFDKCKHKLLIK